MHNTWLRFDVPEDGLPSIDDWITTFSSILLDGLDLGREPLDVSAWSPVNLWKPSKFLSHVGHDISNT